VGIGAAASLCGGRAREKDMQVTYGKGVRRAASVAGALALSAMMTLGAARAADQPYVMKITFPTINDQVHQFARMLAAAVDKDSKGRIKAEVYPASQLGSIPRQIEGVQFGAIQCAAIPPEFFVGVDERFEVLAAPGLVDSLKHGQRLAQDPEVLKLMLSIGANKGLHGAALFMAIPNALIARDPIRHLADLKGKKIRIFASDFQKVALERLGATPVAMTLGDVLPAIQQGAIDGSIAGLTVFTTMHYQDAAKYVTLTGQPAIFIIVEISKKWYEGLPKDLQKIVDDDARRASVEIYPWEDQFIAAQSKVWTDRGGELIKFPPAEQAAMMETLSSVGEDIAKKKPALNAAYQIVTAAAKRTR
jgi:TRAP-type transport system periplasmic protein